LGPAPSDVKVSCLARRRNGSATFSPSPLQASDPIVVQYIELCRAERIDMAGIEFVEGPDGRRYTYDINANTNYNAALGHEIGVDGMREVARWLKVEALRMET
jgi:hypothetical protein